MRFGSDVDLLSAVDAVLDSVLLAQLEGLGRCAEANRAQSVEIVAFRVDPQWLYCPNACARSLAVTFVASSYVLLSFAPMGTSRIAARCLVEFPMGAATFLGVPVPVSGGGATAREVLRMRGLLR